MNDFDPDMSLRTLRNLVKNYDGTDTEPQLKQEDLLAMMIGTFEALDNHLSTGGHLPAPWRNRGGV